MAITDLQISEELMTDAPSIKYRGDEGPKSPQEEQQMMVDALLKEEYNNYVYDLLEQRPDATPMSFEEFRRMVIAEGQMSGGQPLPQDPTEPVNPFKPKPIGPVLPDKRQMAAYGGIMGVDGRRQYGIGSWFQSLKDKVVDDIIPNEIKDNPLLTAALVAGGDQLLNQGRITNTVLDSILGAKDVVAGKTMDTRSGGILETIKDLGTGAKDATVEFLGKQTNPNDPKSKTYGQAILSSIGKNIVPILGGVTAGLFTKNTESDTPGLPSDTTALNLAELKKGANLATQKQGIASGLNFLPDVAARKFTPEEMAITYAQSAANGGRIGFSEGTDSMTFGLLSDNADISEEINQKVIDYENEYMQRTGNVPPEFYGEKYRMKLMEEYMNQNKAEGGRIGFESGLRALKSNDIPPVKMPDVLEQMLQNMSEEERIKFLMMMRNNAERMPKIEPNPDAIPPVRMPTFPNNNDLDIPTRLNILNQPKAMPRTMAMGGRIGYANGGGGTQFQLPFGKPDYFTGSGKNRRGIYIQPDGTRLVVPIGSDDLPSYAQGGRVPAQEGGLMDLGGLEKDYRAEGGFVPIGKEEKADDVPARLSVNEFVFTADAVRNAGGGDIDEGARVMENMMKHLEAGGQVSEESQGMAGARDMFATSQRLSEVV